MPRCCTDEEKMLGLPNVQLNKYETAPNFIQLNQNLTPDSLLTEMKSKNYVRTLLNIEK